MSEVIENHIQLLLAGKMLDADDLSNVISNVQGAESGGKKGARATSNAAYVPICHKTVTYIVAGIVINDQGKVLMMQEAKPSCAGKWYLPAGQVEQNESLYDAVKREVLEETNLVFEPTTLIIVECASGSWFRFVFTGDIVGGTIKTVEQADQESLQACWIQNVCDLSLRSNDIVPLIDRAKNYAKNKSMPQHPHLMPAVRSLTNLLLRLVIVAKKRATNRLHVLVSDSPLFALPVCEINSKRNLLSTLHNVMTEIFGSTVAQHRPHGLLSVEFSGQNDGDGLCLTLLISFKLPLEDVPIAGMFMWHELSENVASSVTSRLPRNMTVPLNVIC